MKNIKMCILKEGIARKERKTERKEKKREKKMKLKKKIECYFLLPYTVLVSAIIFLYLMKTNMSYSCIL